MDRNTQQDLVSDRISSEDELKKATESIIEEFNLEIDVCVETSGRFKQKAGQYRHSERKVRISKHLLENHPEKVIETLKHEIGHAVVLNRYGKRRTKPHGREWKSVMRELGVDNPEACHSLQLTEYSYLVRCTNPDCDVELGRHRKSRLVKKPQLYVCNECGDKFESFKVNRE